MFFPYALAHVVILKIHLLFKANYLSSCDPPQASTPCDSQESTLRTDVTMIALYF